MASDPSYVFVVDDEEDIREIMSTVLELEGFSVKTAQNGRDAVAKLKELPAPALILLDLMMPEMDGFGFLEQVRQGALPHCAAVPVVVVTAFSQKEVPTGAVQLLTKPVPLEHLVRLVRGYLVRPSAVPSTP
jgi:CheY-like chemotaxis protein